MTTRESNREIKMYWLSYPFEPGWRAVIEVNDRTYMAYYRNVTGVRKFFEEIRCPS